MEEGRTLYYDIPAADLPCSLRGWLKKRGYSRRVLVSLMKDDSRVTAEGVPVKLSAFLTDPVRVKIRLPMQSTEALPLPEGPLPEVPVVYEDDDVIVFNKPAGMPTHPVHGHIGDTLADFARRHGAERGENYTFRPVGRLDRNTSGLLLVAKTAYAASRTAPTAEKIYYAVAEGLLEQAGTVSGPIRHKEGSTILREVGEGGEEAITHYEPLKVLENHTLLRLRLETGRTHQIRVHMASVGHPLAGDDLYGGSRDKISRHALHCGELTFTHPVTEQRISLFAPLPADMDGLIK